MEVTKFTQTYLARISEKVFWIVFRCFQSYIISFSASIQTLILAKTLEHAVKNLGGDGSNIVVGTTGETAHGNQMWSKYFAWAQTVQDSKNILYIYITWLFVIVFLVYSAQTAVLATLIHGRHGSCAMLRAVPWQTARGGKDRQSSRDHVRTVSLFLSEAYCRSNAILINLEAFDNQQCCVTFLVLNIRSVLPGACVYALRHPHFSCSEKAHAFCHSCFFK